MKQNKDYILRDIAGDCVLIPTGQAGQDFNGMISITSTAKFIWEHIEEAASFEDLIKLIMDTYDIDEENAVMDAGGFISALLEHGLLELSDEEAGW